LVNEVEQEVRKMFPGLKSYRKNAMSPEEGRAKVFFLPVSAENSFLCKIVFQLPLEQFKNLDKALIDRIGLEECGRYKWKSLSFEKHVKLVHQIVADRSVYEKRLPACNFDKFLNIFLLSDFVEKVRKQ